MAEKITDLKNKCVCSDYCDDKQDAGDDCSLSIEKLNLLPRKKLLVLDVGGLLCQRVHNKSRIRPFRNPDASHGSILVYKRPYYEEFINFCFEKFEVGIWSSATGLNLNSALDCIMEGLKSKLLFIWDQGQCTDSGFKTLEKKDKPIFFKELKKIWDFYEHYSESNTLLIDDTPYKTLLNPPHTAIFPEEYKADQDGDTALGPSGDLRLYLEGLVDADDVPSYVKEHPFGKPAISSSTHSDWEFYSKIISHFRNE
ncbi:uncharacterized protein LOC133873901 [Alnus glutinosa]|uniref:uncharacterized protein LOC133873901 n=1 Tax=Alnus glutinosa TaxID=3517 RepID=UPI002D796BC8|nr:uncharacterized protein LOC133873901 [Alnus glutinosa]